MIRTSITLGIDADLLARAQALGLDLAEVLQIALSQLAPVNGVAETGTAFDAGESPEAIADYNHRIRERGCFGDTWRE